MRASLRTRFALAAGGLVVLISAAVAVAGYLALQRSLIGEARRATGDEAAQLAAVIDTSAGGVEGREQGSGTQGGNYVDLSDPSLVRQFVRPGVWVVILGPAGRPIRTSPASPRGLASTALVAACRRTGSSDGTSSRPAAAVACRRVGTAARTLGFIVTAKPLASAQRTLDSMAHVLMLAVLVGGLTSFALAWLLARRALRPLRLIAATARSIRDGDLSRRIGHARRDELGEVASELDASFAELERALRRQERFVADASHELKTPLAATLANVQLLRRWAAEDPDARTEALAALERSAARMSRLVSDLLQLARGDDRLRYAREQVRLDDLLLEVQRDAQALAGEVEVVIERLTQVSVVGDRDRLQQLLANLVDNAVHASPAGGTVRLALDARDELALVTVADEGPGIAAEELPHVFERFFRGRGVDTGSGAGLGLAIARTIARSHGGEVEVSSAPGSGTVFSVTLPRELSSDRHRRFMGASSRPDSLAGAVERR